MTLPRANRHADLRALRAERRAKGLCEACAAPAKAPLCGRCQQVRSRGELTRDDGGYQVGKQLERERCARIARAARVDAKTPAEDRLCELIANLIERERG